ncbi:c-type cytochrome biogenesis protein CcmI [Paracoccus tegillarcae]|uniref:C-type cytochrome biogenesis protein CcmI n=1 Tax=Paracoccus tegillarcae TaxID=1529068 RepID=A0A2K9ELN5_9RHOB|nr:c-type cytochrome biogenesis protein CcmI [Paracoccus tegillarcae]
MFWLICGAMAAIVAVAILTPLWRGDAAGKGAAPAAAYDLQVYRDQLREVDRDLQRRVIGAEDAERLRQEIGRKVLDADRRLAMAEPGRRVGSGRIGAALAVAAVVAGTVWLYQREGVPGMPDLPLSERIAAAQATYEARPSQAEAQADTPAPARGEIDPEYAALIDELRSAVKKTPDDPEGLALLAMHESRLGNLDAALAAQNHLIAVKGDDTTAQDHAFLAGLMAEAAGGIITAEAERELARALKTDPRHPQVRYMLGLLQAQNGRPDRAFPIWRDLLAEGPPDAPWIAPIRASIQDLAWLAGDPDYAPPEPAGGTAAPALPGPDAEGMAAAEEMSPEDRQQMIAGMVAQLEGRLAEEGGSPEEWARLIGAHAVLGNIDHARNIWNEAQTRFADQPEALAVVQAGAEQAGLAE